MFIGLIEATHAAEIEFGEDFRIACLCAYDFQLVATYGAGKPYAKVHSRASARHFHADMVYWEGRLAEADRFTTAMLRRLSGRYGQLRRRCARFLDQYALP